MTHQETGTRWQGLKYAILRSWTQLRDEVRRRWERLSEDDIAEIEGEVGRLTDKISQRYGVAREEAEHQIREWVTRDVPWIQQVRTVPSFRWTMIFLAAALIGAIVGFTPLTELVRSIARWLFYVSVLGFVIFLAINLSMRTRK